MTTFDEREKAYEKKFALDEELRFKVTARRNRLLGLWAAEKMGMTGVEAENYAKAVIKADFEKHGIDDLVAKLMADFKVHKVNETEHQVRRTIAELSATAMQQFEKQLP